MFNWWRDLPLSVLANTHQLHTCQLCNSESCPCFPECEQTNEDRTNMGTCANILFVSEDCIRPTYGWKTKQLTFGNQTWHIKRIFMDFHCQVWLLQGSKTHVCSSHSAGPCAWCCPLIRACAHPNTPYISCIHLAPTNAWYKIPEESTAVWWNRTSQKANKQKHKQTITNIYSIQMYAVYSIQYIHCESFWENPPLLEVQSILHCVASS